jgi:hypothetical protein
MQSCPDAFILNLDESSTTNADPQATLWPGISPDGRTIDTDGTPFVVTWDHVLAKKKILIDLALANQNRPRIIVLDSLTAAIRLLQKWITQNAVELKISSEPRTDWKELHGPAAWDTLYTMIVDFMITLHSHGYGVYYIGHLVNAKVPLNEDKFLIRPELTITDNFYKRLYPYFEMVAAIAVRDGTETVERETKVNIRGVEKLEKRKETINVRKRYLVTDDTDMNEILGRRVKIPGMVELPETGSWESFQAIYLAHAHTGIKPKT